MNCPLCGEHCRCAEPRAFAAGAPEFVDPEAPDYAEEQFAASLETSAAPPPRYDRIALPEAAPMEEPPLFANAPDDFALAAQDESKWRTEVANRVESYRAKRGRRRIGGAFSMELDFEERAAEPAPPPFTPAPAEYSATATAPAAQPLTVRWDGMVEGAAPAPAEPEFIPEEPGPRLPEVWNVIPFPGASGGTTIEDFPRADELAEPILDTPRILDAPEMVDHVIPTPMAEISLEEDEQPADLPDDVEIPLQVVPLPQRMVGGMADFLIVLAATAMFALIVLNIAGAVPASKALLAVALVVPCLLWIGYQYIFLVHGGRTPGMQFAGLSLAQFEGEPVGARLRRSRALAMALSSVSLGLGFVWALVDEDTLCWHDRITRTYPVQRDRGAAAGY